MKLTLKYSSIRVKKNNLPDQTVSPIFLMTFRMTWFSDFSLTNAFVCKLKVKESGIANEVFFLQFDIDFHLGKKEMLRTQIN